MSGHSKSFARRVTQEAFTATFLSTVMLAIVAKIERRGALQPLNATSHWLHGPRVANDSSLSGRATGVGLATHLAATAFWAAIYETWVRRSDRAATTVVAKAVAMAGISAVVDYRATPKRFTPGWEFVLTPGAMAAVYLALSAGLAAGAFERRD